MTELEQKLTDMLEKEQEKNHALTLLLLERQGSIEPNTTVIVPENKHHGVMPWDLRKAMLERKFSKKTKELESLEDLQDAS